ncbi:MAG: HAD-IC family P-type ATPase, partial [Candidatus Aenigmarchaeota archaeon]|nr:HAD-IC family P-type ATPase [Candidatus Aenigmarchaeota archaeon]
MIGLTTEESNKRLKIYGKNIIERKKKISPIKIFTSQFTSPIIILLIVASILSFSISHFKGENYFDGILILIIVFISGLAGFIQDYKAEKAVEALRRMTSPKARVVRDGKEIEVDASEIVPGDVVVLEGGDIVPADSKIIDGKLEVDESIITGESRAVKKSVNDKIFSGCRIFTGNAKAEVIATGMNTKIGKIASHMESIEEGKTPFQEQMSKFTTKVVILTSLIILITFSISVGKFGLTESILIAVSLAVAAIPEDLPAVITTTLSLGAKGMVKKNALVRRLAISESIGSVDVICTDKTGTLTEGNMGVKDLVFLKGGEKTKELSDKCCYYCNDAKLILKDGKKEWVGDETDIALRKHAKEYPGKRIDEISFSSERKMMTVAYDINDKKFVFSKGAPEVIIKKCSRYLENDKIKRMDLNTREKILRKNKELASKGYRILALAYKEYKKPLEKNLIFIGLVILEDPPRPMAREAVEECKSAGIRVIMLTGDNPETARAIANEVSIDTTDVITGNKLKKMSDYEILKALENGVNIFARIDPFHKLRILEVLQRNDHVVAMTGDGVNDSLALK